VSAYGNIGDASSALWLFSKYVPRTTRTWNVLLGAMARVAEREGDLCSLVDPISSSAASVFLQEDTRELRASNSELISFQKESGVFDVVQRILGLMCGVGYIDGISAPTADSQTFCVAAAALQYGPTCGAHLPTEMFRNATSLGVPADGRFLNAVLRCFGNDIDAALQLWKDEIRPQCLSLERQLSSISKKNLLAAYNGLLHVCGRALRPDIALRVVYAMNKDGLEPNEASLNSYRSGSRICQRSQSGGFAATLERKLKLIEQYESLLLVECTKYDRDDRRRVGERRVRIIL
jgi:pentatricopeptide repeat protein